VIRAREIQAKRYLNCSGTYANAQISSKQLREICVIGTAGESLLKKAMERLNLSARAYDRILKVSRMIADLAGSEDIKPEHLAEAIHYRSLDREGWPVDKFQQYYCENRRVLFERCLRRTFLLLLLRTLCGE